ncbi:hypothetical protein CXB51_016552 [Gossypium anomalum]|uniref:RNase H type-1 domain-containing protein n=1 Tax=Gossypium anomalum TaxID=47600 RepID=A0A8J6CUY8_9ROSI|nr:hypothetical protein CXB51_016552 [Gossypium anomalum]
MVYFSPNTPVDQRLFFGGLLKMHAVDRIHSWSKRLLPYGGKEVFIKSVLQSIPTYALSVFLAPKSILEDLQAKISRMWWGSNDKNRSWSMIAWERCFPKCMGGLGFKDLRLFNLALLGRQVWRLITCKETLCYNVLRSKYFPNGNIFTPKNLISPRTFGKALQRRLGPSKTISIGIWVMGEVLIAGMTIRGLKVGYGPHRFFWRSIWKLKDFNKDCPRSRASNETLIHAFKDCPTAREILVLGGLNNKLLEGSFSKCIDWIEDVMRVLDNKAVSDFVTTLWNSWNNRNNFLFRVPPSEKCWLKPPHDIVKINFDAVVSPKNIGVGMIVRDSDGFVLGGGGSVTDAKMTAAWAKFKALEESIKFAKALNIQKVYIETDCVSLVNRINRRGQDILLWAFTRR